MIEYWRALRRSFLVIILLSVGASLMAGVLASRAAKDWRVYYSYVVSMAEREQKSDFRFDGYYALQATDLFTETLAAWVTTPEVIVAAHAAARLPLPSQDSRVIGQLVEAKQSAPQLVQVTVKGSDQAHAKKLAEGLITVMKERVAAYHEQATSELTFSVVASEPWVGSREISRWVVAAATFIFVCLAGINVVLMREALRHADRH